MGKSGVRHMEKMGAVETNNLSTSSSPSLAARSVSSAASRTPQSAFSALIFQSYWRFASDVCFPKSHRYTCEMWGRMGA